MPGPVDFQEFFGGDLQAREDVAAERAFLDLNEHPGSVACMTVLEIKNQISSLKPREINELHAYLARLRHATPEWKKSTARKIRAVLAGQFIAEEQIEEHLTRG